MERLGSNQQDIKTANRALALKMLCTKGGMTRTELAKYIGLTRMSVTNIVSELMDTGLVRERSVFFEKTYFRGRKPTNLEVVSDALFAIGLHISRDALLGTVIDLVGHIHQFSVRKITPGETQQTLLSKVDELLDELFSSVVQEKILGIGVAVIGPVDVRQGMILSPPEFYGLGNILIREHLSQRFRLPIIIEQEMNAAAMAEKYFGHAVHYSDFIYVGVTHGIGAGIYTQNMLCAGGHGFSGEIGHCSICFDGPVCPCGNRGCLEIYASINNVVRRTCERIARGEKSLLAAKEQVTWLSIVEAAHMQDALAQSVMEELAQHLSVALVTLINTFDPQAIILGHDIALAGELVLQPLKKLIYQNALFAHQSEVALIISKFVDKAPYIGAGVLILNQLLSGEIPINF